MISDAPVGQPHETAIAFPSGPITLSGTVTTPVAPRAAAVLINGSGDLDRDGNSRRARLGISRDIAAALAATGVASLRFDKRGVGASGGDYLSAGLDDNIDDARAAIAALRARPEAANLPTVVIGHSEGAMIAAAIAGEPANQLDGAVLLSASAGTGEDVLLWQAAQIAPTLPEPVKLIMRVLRTDPLRQQRKALARLKATTTDIARIQGVRMNAKWFRELLAFDTRPALMRIRVPVLAITGAKDLQVNPDDLDVIASTVPGPVTLDRVPDLTHILRRDAESPTIGAYRRLIREPVDRGVLQEISDWIEKLAAAGGDQRSSAEG
jgi:pimeloyl-ACP methyl ester carboxylesterase